MTLGEKQKLFFRLSFQLYRFILMQGYEATKGHAFRCGDCKVGRKTSLHKLCLAEDIYLFRDGVYLEETEDHRPIGEFWESLHPLCSWGGRFNDGNHYSLRHGNRR